ncbi:hypothetical protein Tco_1028644 [Tanacetum coccineum]|uniref:Uncharacterized protein n=1 Tax=Tanacetum coccineum TaxID=301880 RepID=A0ABQ5G171_9ASTR
MPVERKDIMRISAQKQITEPQESILRDELAFVRFRISTLETTLKDIQVSSESSSYSVLTDQPIRRIHQLDTTYPTFCSEQRIEFYYLNGVSVLDNTAYSLNFIRRIAIQQAHKAWCVTRSSTKELLSPLENPERVLRSRRKLFDNPSLVETSSPESEQLYGIEEHIEEEEVTETMAKTMEQYMSKTR